MVGKVPRWEAELWSYVSSGDGVRCPVYDRCRIRQSGGWCVSDHAELFNELLDTSQFNPRDYDFLKRVTLGRVFQLVDKLAYRLLEVGKVSCPPVPEALVGLADEVPIEVRLVPFVAHHGAIWRLTDSWVIQLNRNDPPARRRFTLFHEAFHIFAHCRCRPVFRKRRLEVGSFNELLAEHFAICVLTPREWVKEKWVEVKDLARMAEIFDVTEAVIWLRLKYLGLT